MKKKKEVVNPLEGKTCNDCRYYVWAEAVCNNREKGISIVKQSTPACDVKFFEQRKERRR